MTRIAFYGSSLLSSYWNGAATYYRGLLRNLAALGYDITFYEADDGERRRRRDLDPPEWCRVIAYPATAEGARLAAAQAASADVVAVASGNAFGNELVAGVLAGGRADGLRLFWDVDAPRTLQELRRSDLHPLRQALPQFDAVLTNGGGPPVAAAYTALKARRCAIIYNGFDPATHHPAPADHRFTGDLGFLGNLQPGRDARAEEFFLMPARRMAERRFMLAGSGWDEKPAPPNVVKLRHLRPAEHNAFNRSCLAVLNIARGSLAAAGFSPSARVFEAAGAGACLITEQWEGIGYFLKPGEHVLIARDGQDVADHLAGLTPELAKEIGLRALEHVLTHHTYANRAAEVDAVLQMELRRKREAAAA